MSVVQQQIKLAQALPPRLLAFFARFPPQSLVAAETKSTPNVKTVANTSSMDPNIGAASTQDTVTTAPTLKKYNPFLPVRTGHNWRGPAYSLRRQAELYKLAEKHNVLSLMPVSPKHPEVKLQKRIDFGLRVQGTGEGRRVKGKAWERTLQHRLEKRQKAMEGMPEMIRLWKQRGHGRGWKKWPK